MDRGAWHATVHGIATVKHNLALSFFLSFGELDPMCVCLVTQSCPALSDPVNCSLPDSFSPWNFPGKNTGVVCHFLLQGIFPTQGWSLFVLCLLLWQADSLPLRHLGICH